MNRARVLCKLTGGDYDRMVGVSSGQTAPNADELAAMRILDVAENLQETYFRACFSGFGLVYRFSNLQDDEVLAWCAVAKRFPLTSGDFSVLRAPEDWDKAPRMEVREIHIPPPPMSVLQHIDVARGKLMAMTRTRAIALAITKLDEAVHWINHVG